MSTDIIVGFPGETEADFEQTLAVAAEAEYDYAYTFVFSPRQGTEAASMEADFVDPAVVSERFERLRLVVERSALRRHEARVGRIEEVLVEGPSKRDAGGHQRPHSSEQARALRAATPVAHRQLRDRRDHARRPALPRGAVRRVHLRTDPQAPHPRRRPLMPRPPKNAHGIALGDRLVRIFRAGALSSVGPMSEGTVDPQLADYRASIDNIDAALVHLLAERFKITKAVGRYKATVDLPPADEDRERIQIERLRALAEQSGLDPVFTEKFLRFIVAEVIHHHQRIAEGEQL